MLDGNFHNSTGGRADAMTWRFQHSPRGRKGNPEVLLWCYLHFASFPLLACCAASHAHTCVHTHTHIMRKSITVQLKGQQITSCTFMMSVCVCSCAPVCECILTCPGTSTRCFGKRQQSSLNQLRRVCRKMCLKNPQEAHDRAWRTTWE